MLTFDPSFFIGVFPRLISALPFTVEVIIASILLCLFFGTIIAVIRIARVPVLAPFSSTFTSSISAFPPSYGGSASIPTAGLLPYTS